MNAESFGIGCAEALAVLSLMGGSEASKIDIVFIKLLKANQKKDYRVTLDPSKPLAEQGLSKIGMALLSLVYKNYFASAEEKQAITEADLLAIERMKETGEIPTE